MTVSRYDATQCSVAINGIPVTRFGAGDMITATKTNNNATTTTDAMGNGQMAIANDDLGTITINVDPASKAYKEILEMAPKNVSVAIRVVTPFEIVSDPAAVLQKTPEVAAGAGYPTRSCVFECAAYDVSPTSFDYLS